jgi:hypothetical protein
MVCERHMKRNRGHMDKDIYIYKYDFWDILKRVISATLEESNQPPELSIVFVFFYVSKELHVYLNVQGKTE